MKILNSYFLSVFLAAGIVSASPITVTADLVNGGAQPLADASGYLVGPYTLNINGMTYAAMCVDFADEGHVGKSYTAIETQVGGNLANTYHSTDNIQYEEEAYLMSLLQQPNANRVNIQDAAWAITDSKYQASNAAQAYVSMAAANYSSFNYSGYTVVSDVLQGCGREQEYMINSNMATPEPGSLMLMGGGLLVAGLARRRMKAKV